MRVIPSVTPAGVGTAAPWGNNLAASAAWAAFTASGVAAVKGLSKENACFAVTSPNWPVGAALLPKKLPSLNAILPKPAIPPAINAPFKESFKLLPLAKPPARLPNPVAKAIGIAGNKNGATIGSTIGASFLTTFLRPLKSFFKKNSGWPVCGLIEFSSLPTM